MGFSFLDYSIVALYLIGVTSIGTLVAGRQKTSQDYFLGGRKMSWWSVGFSIVASETSTLTFISIPGLAYTTNMHFLQLVVGYFIGRVLVSFIFIPAYYNGNLETAYDFLGKRYGMSLRKFTSSVFIVTRVLASGVRLFATAIPVHLITQLNYPTCILLIGIFTLIYTYVGGLKAVVAMDVVQMFIYIGGAAASMMIIVHRLPNGWTDVVTYASANGMDKFSIVNTSFGNSFIDFLSRPYTLIGGLLGGTFLTMASHGTDQLLVQRLLGCRSKRESQRALLLDASLIVLQFAFFLLLGLCLFAFYGGASLSQLGVTSSDEIFPKFIVENLPSGIAGLVVAGVLASAMGTLSSSISSLASSTFLDLFRSTARGKNLDHTTELRWSKRFTLLWGIILIGGAMLFTDTKNPVVEIGLKIASFTYGGLLGTFFLGLLFKRTDQTDAYAGFIAGIATMIIVLTYTRIDFTWHTFIGCAATIIVGNLSRYLRSNIAHQNSSKG
ncbi:MAG: sodium:solute symporter [Bacteroidota bacterium]|nr:sodium:solute symporter [Bacteroidota bacterium]